MPTSNLPRSRERDASFVRPSDAASELETIDRIGYDEA